MKKRWLQILLGGVIVGGSWFGYAAWRASKDIVTLDVRNMDVKDVIAKIEGQTWEKIYLRGEVRGQVTLGVTDLPLDDVLEMISEQTNARWSALYPLYSSRQSLSFLKRSLSGEDIDPPNLWTNLQRGPSFSFRGGFMNVAQDQNNLVSVKLEHQDLNAAARALSRYSRGEVVPENGSFSVINLDLNQATMPEAVEALSKQANKDWTRLYVLRGWGRDGDRDRGSRREMAGDESREDRREGRRNETNEVFSANGTNDVNSTNSPPWERPGFREEMEKRFQEALATMTPEERKRAEEMRKQFQEMRNMTPEQRKEAMNKMAQNPQFQQAMKNREKQRLQNSTPEQRAERTRRMEQSKRDGGSGGGGREGGRGRGGPPGGR